METITRKLQQQDAQQTAALDAKWFEYSLNLEDVQKFIDKSGENTLGVFTENGDLLGFATFEVLENELPTEYVGNVPHVGKVLFLGNFTTVTNYNSKDSSADAVLLAAVEQKAKELDCVEVWEALALDHPYKRENNPGFDAFGFYEKHGFKQYEEGSLVWEPNSKVSSIPCVLFRKSL